MVPLFRKNIEYYNNIDTLPIHNWFKLHETNDLRWLSKENIFEYDLKVKEAKELNVAFEAVNAQFIDTFGVSEPYRKILELRYEIIQLKFEMLNTGDRTIQNLINVCEAELAEILNENHKVKHNQVTGYIEKEMGFVVDETKVSVLKYYTWLNLMKDGKGK